MRTRATLLATLVLGAFSVAQAQEGPGIGAGGPQLERGGGPAMGGEGPGPGIGPGDGGERGVPEPPRPGPPREAQGDPQPSPEPEQAAPRADREDAQRGPRAQRDDDGDRPARARKAKGADDDAKKAPKAAERRKDDDQAKERKERQVGKEDGGDGDAKRDAAGKADTPTQGRAEDEPAGTAPKAAEGGERKPAEAARQADLSGDKRDRVRNAFRDRGDVKRRTDVDVDISIGRRLPRGWGFAPVPIAVVEIVPEYRDYVYVYVEDEYVICDPDTYEVVAVIPAGGGIQEARGGGAAPENCTTAIRLDAEERDLILNTVEPGRQIDVSDLKVGWSVPGNVELHRFSDEVLAEAGELSACRYFVAEDQLAIVDPEEDKVVLIIDKG